MQANTLDEITHYYRVCNTCGYGWWGLHCPHDGYQNDCSNCNTRPTTLPDELCKCEFVAEVETVQALITEARIDELGKIDSRSFISLGSDFVYTVYQSDLDKRIEQLEEKL